MILAAAFGVARGEEFAPELHDNDAADASFAANGAAPAESTPSVPQGHRPDTPHACHCFHVHALWVDAVMRPTPVALAHSRRVPETAVMPPAIALPPHLRPPIT